MLAATSLQLDAMGPGHGMARKIARTKEDIDSFSAQHGGKVRVVAGVAALGALGATAAMLGSAYINAQKIDTAKKEADIAEARRTVYTPVFEKLKAGSADRNYINRTLIDYVSSGSSIKYLDPITVKLLILNGADQDVIEQALKIAVIPANYDQDTVEAILTTIPQNMRNAPIEAQLTRIIQMADPIVQVITCALQNKLEEQESKREEQESTKSLDSSSEYEEKQSMDSPLSEYEEKQYADYKKRSFNFEELEKRYPGLLGPELAPSLTDDMSTKEAKLIHITLISRRYMEICKQLNLNKAARAAEIRNKITRNLNYLNSKRNLQVIEPLEIMIPEEIAIQNSSKNPLTVQVVYKDNSSSKEFDLKAGDMSNLENLVGPFDMNKIKLIKLTSKGWWNKQMDVTWAEELKKWQMTRDHTQTQIRFVVYVTGVGTGALVTWKMEPVAK